MEKHKPNCAANNIFGKFFNDMYNSINNYKLVNLAFFVISYYDKHTLDNNCGA